MGIGSPAAAATLYRVRVNTSEFTGTAHRLALDWVSGGSPINSARIASLLNPDDAFPFVTVDPLGANALFAIDVTGQSGGDLNVFAPMRFVPPDTLLLSNSTDDVAPGDRTRTRLQFRSIAPNPSSGGVRLVYAIPEPGGELA
jgi:hypothetical protein